MRPPRDPRPPKDPPRSRKPVAPKAKSPSAQARDQRRAEQHALDTSKPRPQPVRSEAQPKPQARPRRNQPSPVRPPHDPDASRPAAARRGAGRLAPRTPAAVAAPVGPGQGGERIAKLLARAGIASRREIERFIAEGRVAIGGVPVETPATILKSLDGVTVDGKPVQAAEAARLFRFHKPTGFLTAERDPRGRPTIYDRLPRGLPRLMPVGRLDMNTEGLLLLTTDGGLKRKLELPATGVERVYRARVFGEVSQQQLEALIDGIEIDGVRYGSIDANMERRTGRNFWVEMRLREGKNREVRRVLEHLGLQVSRLIRTRYGPFPLGDVAPGAIDEVRPHELANFLKTLR